MEQRQWRGWHGLGRNAAAAATAVLLASCANLDKSWIPGTAASLAKDQIMLVREDPPSFGFTRLATRAEIYPDLLLFVKQSGIPDFMAETSDDDRQYFILYYLKTRRAYACRTHVGHPGALEFAGPYPMTERELRLLDNFRRSRKR